MLLIDAHTHLDDKQFSDIDDVIVRAKDAGVKRIVTNGIDVASNRKALALADKYDIVLPALGLYPIEATKMSADAIDEEIAFIRSKRDAIISIGEIGIDEHWLRDKVGEMVGPFRKMIALAKELEKPITVHSRDAEERTIEVLEEEDAKNVIMHCFGGGKKLVKRILDNGWYLTIPTSVVYDGHFQWIVEMAPLSRILTETDAPYLGPVRGERNEPAFIKAAVEKIAEIKKMVPEEAANIIFKNYMEVFG
ncbi:MAG: TatD family hydrolase [archaeon]